MKKECETIQFSISNKFDASISLDQSETKHIESCSDCQQFHSFVYSDFLQQVANPAASEKVDIEHDSQVTAILDKLHKEQSKPTKESNNVIRFFIASAAVAAIGIMSISQFIQPEADSSPDEIEVVGTDMPTKKNASAILLTIPEIKLDEQGSAINSAMVDRLEIVSHSIKKLKSCFEEGNAFLDKHTESESKPGPEGRNSMRLERRGLSRFIVGSYVYR